MKDRLTPASQISRDCPILSSLKMACHEIAIRFLCPVYLVGSFLTNPVEASDIDIIIVMSEDRFKRLFGEVHFNYHQLKWRNKQKAYLEDHLRTWDIDFKPQTPKVFESWDGDILRLDTVPDSMLMPTLDELFTFEEEK
jgi:predicted nucleotidyltransferase